MNPRTFDYRDLIPLAAFAAHVGAAPKTVLRWGAAGVPGLLVVRLSRRAVYIINTNLPRASRPAEPAVPGWRLTAIATALAVSTATVRNWAAHGHFKLIITPGRHPLVERASFTAWIHDCIQASRSSR